MSKPFKILLIEDNPADIRMAEEAFKECSSKISLSYVLNGFEAIDFLTKSGQYENEADPDLIILDLNLPKINGFEVLARVKQEEGLKQIPILIFTTSESEEDIKKCYELGANSFISKPITLDTYVQTIKLIERYWLNLVKLPRHN